MIVDALIVGGGPAGRVAPLFRRWGAASLIAGLLIAYTAS
jgi:hypothetical protein